GTVVGTSNTGSQDFQEVSLAGERTGTFYAEVFAQQPFGGLLETGNANYTLTITPPAAASDDPYEQNDNTAQVDAAPPGGANSPNLGTLTTTKQITNLVLDDPTLASPVDYFRFQTSAVSTTANKVRIDFTNANGHLSLTVLRADGTVVGTSNTGSQDF